MHIFLKDFQGKTYTIELKPTDTLEKLRDIIQHKLKIPGP